ncbi:MAG: RNA polymerase sigma factor [Chlorobi bacterium]|nr:RNA polymerase sigma factor [Chlorobiota bacterium]
MVERIIQSCIRGEKYSQKVLYEAFYGKMFAICIRYTGNYSEAQDVLHDGFIKIFTRLKSFKNEGSLEGWIRRIVVNNAIDYIKKRKKVFIDNIEVNILENIEDPNFEEAELQKLNELKAQQIMDLIQQLSPAYRTVFNMYVIEEYSHKEIAEKLNISVGTSKSNLAKAKIRLREIFAKHKLKNE